MKWISGVRVQRQQGLGHQGLSFSVLGGDVLGPREWILIPRVWEYLGVLGTCSVGFL